MTEDRQAHLNSLRAEIAARLAQVCRDWPEEMFDEMVRGLAAITMRYEGQAGETSYDRRPTDRLIEDMKEIAKRSADIRKKL